MKVKILFPLLVCIVLIVIWKSNVLSIKTVKISNLSECVTSEDLNREINNFDKTQILIDSSKIKKILISKFTCIKDISVFYEFPRTIKMNILGRKFLAKVISYSVATNLIDMESTASSQAALVDWNMPAESSDEAYVVDETGYIFTKVNTDFALSVIFVTDSLNLGTQLNAQSFNQINLIFSKIQTLDPIMYQPYFKTKKDRNSLFINSNPRVSFSLEKDVLKQLASLQLILQKAKIDEKMAEFIDLRFDKPVIQFRTNLSK